MLAKAAAPARYSAGVSKCSSSLPPAISGGGSTCAQAIRLLMLAHDSYGVLVCSARNLVNALTWAGLSLTAWRGRAIALTPAPGRANDAAPT